MLRHVAIESRLNWADCDCCGSFEYGSASLVVDGENKFEAHHDGHLGGGSWDGTELSLRRMALGLCGYAPFINGELAEGIPLLDNGEVDESGNAMWVPVHECVDFKRIDIVLETLGDDPHYPTPVKATWIDPFGATQSHVFKDADWDAFWVVFSVSFAQIDFEFSRGDSDWDDDSWDD